MTEHVWEIAQTTSTGYKLGAGPQPSDLLLHRCVIQITHLPFEWPLWEWYMADKTMLDGQKLKAALDQFAEGGLR